MGKTQLCGVVTLLCLAVSISPAAADGDMEQVTGISFTPRMWLSSIDPVALPMYGGTLAVTPSFATNYSVLLTGLWGEGDGNVRVPGSTLNDSISVGVINIPVDFVVDPSIGTAESERLDVELLIRRRFPDKWFSLFFGPRYASFKETTAGTVGYKLTAAGTAVREESADLVIELESDFYGLELGLGTVAEITTDGRHSLFSNFIAAAAYTEWKATGRAMQGALPDLSLLELLGMPTEDTSGENFDQSLDTNLGYQYGGDRFGLSVRYRIFVLITKNATEQTQFTTLHGPEFGLTITM
jgi:hypothetical protein